MQRDLIHFKPFQMFKIRDFFFFLVPEKEKNKQTYRTIIRAKLVKRKMQEEGNDIHVKT